MSKEKLQKLEKQITKSLEPYTKELGSLLLSWNSLHTQLTSLFLRICETPEGEPLPRDILLAVWNAVPNDRMQREMLRRAAIVKFGRHTETMKKIGIDIEPIRINEQDMLDEILWILKKADGLGRQRDDAAHVPTAVSIPYAVSDTMFEIAPLDFFEHPIAKQLAGQNLVELFALQRRRIDLVSEYARAWEWYLAGHGSRPQKPSWPDALPSSGHKAEKGQGTPKRRQPRRKSSPK